MCLVCIVTDIQTVHAFGSVTGTRHIRDKEVFFAREESM